MEIIFIPIILLLMSSLGAVNFYLFVGRQVSIKESFKLVTSALALNKLLFTGSGYLVSSFFSRSKNLPFYKTLTVFAFLEFMGNSLWLILGIYFGAKLAIRVPLALIIILIIFGITFLFKRHKFILFFKNILQYFKEVGARIFLILPFTITNVFLVVLYYFFLFRFFSFHTGIPSILKIVSVSFTIGYLSPAPSGIGFKDTGLVLLLVREGIDLPGALSIAIWDRLITTFFWISLGGVVGFNLIKEVMKEKFKIKLKSKESKNL